ncbi:MAG TPA: PQQ-dependent dehydrogenase, methanol/ethanol family [Terriglobia bacterium]|nr:PQQ-dependent dehydrogenase, methanol/ethanol family [Terriglobia bacterium]
MQLKTRSVVLLAAVMALLHLVAPFPLVAASEVTSQRLIDAAKEPHNWLIYSGTYNAWRYSPLDQINKTNIKKLVPVWTFQTGKIDGGFSCTPLVADGVMYITSPSNRVFALDAVTGKELWHYYYPVPKEFGLIYGPWNRGVALGYGLVFMGTIDNSLVALDAKTGAEVWKVNIESMQQCGCNITGAPLVVKDKVIVGVTGGDSAHRGYLNAFDAKTGKRAWRFWTIPGPGEKGHETWVGDSWKHGGGATWMTGSYDPELNLVYWGVGNPAADFYGEARKGSNLYTDCIIALDADSGQLKWHYQEIPHDVWDWDAAYESVLLDLPVKGVMRKLLVNPNKGGYTWVLDRTNGKFVNAWPMAETINWIKGVDAEGNLLGRNEPPAGKPTLICPSIGGGRSWNHAAYSPRTGFFYQTGIEWCQTLTVQQEDPKPGSTFFGGLFELRKPPSGEAWSHFDAYDPVTGKKHWTYKSKYPLLASALATGSDLVFTGDPEGSFFALDGKTGHKLWSFSTGSGHRGSPMTYAVNGRQYIVVPSGWGSAVAGLLPQIWPETEAFPGGCTLFAFALME